jgi:aromatic ring-opening dioxygenase catalytic subunit (LigB family)
MTHAHQIVFVSHGGGPSPLLGAPEQQDLVKVWEALVTRLRPPKAIIVISAHWESTNVRITAGDDSTLLYDYYNFPPESYEIQYPCPGHSALAAQIGATLAQAGFAVDMEHERGLDHGVFVPLKKMYPEANIPVVEVSLLASLDADEHIKLGQALAQVDSEDLLILGSGFSFHNMRWFRADDKYEFKVEEKNRQFQGWLQATLTDENLTESQRRAALSQWERAPQARFSHPREEHLLPLHVCYGAAGKLADQVDRVRAFDLSCLCVSWLGRQN